MWIDATFCNSLQCGFRSDHILHQYWNLGSWPFEVGWAIQFCGFMLDRSMLPHYLSFCLALCSTQDDNFCLMNTFSSPELVERKKLAFTQLFWCLHFIMILEWSIQSYVYKICNNSSMRDENELNRLLCNEYLARTITQSRELMFMACLLIVRVKTWLGKHPGLLTVRV